MTGTRLDVTPFGPPLKSVGHIYWLREFGLPGGNGKDTLEGGTRDDMLQGGSYRYTVIGSEGTDERFGRALGPFTSSVVGFTALAASLGYAQLTHKDGISEEPYYSMLVRRRQCIAASERLASNAA